MTFAAAIEALKAGKKVRRRVWPTGEYAWVVPGSTYLRTNDYHGYIAVATDTLNNTDWEIYEEGHDFQWALNQLRAGNSVRRNRVSSDKIGSGQIPFLVINATNYNDGTNRFNLNDINAKDWQLYC